MARLSWLVLLLAPGLVHAQASPARASRPEPQAFVQAFYDWYVPLTLQPDSTLAWIHVLSARPSVLSADLTSALRADAEARARDSAEVVGLDGDPLLDAQDPCERYVAGRATRMAHGYRVPVYAACGGQRATEPSVVAELRPWHGTWQFVNFYYPGPQRDDLRALLQRLSAGREHPHE